MTTFHELLRDGARTFGDRTAILFEEESLSYAALLARVESAAGSLLSLGVTGADNVALIMDNSIACVLAWLASSVIGCTEIPINPQYRGDLLAYFLSDSETSVIICDGAYLGQVAELLPKLPALRTIIVNGETDAPIPGSPPVLRFDPLAQHRLQDDACKDAPERVILYTSGTTGPSKGVVHTQRSSLTLARYNAQMLEYDETDRLLNFFPLYHQNARYTGVIPALCAGASIRLQRRFSSSGFWRTCDRDGTTAFNYLGSVLRLILNATPPDRVAGTHRIVKAFGAGAPPALWETFERRLGIRLVETYGLSEAPMATLNMRKGDRRSRIGSAGRASDLFDVGIVDGEDRLLPPGEIGEIVLRPKRPDAMMTGYYRKEAATVRAYRNLWFHSGDRGRLSEAGDLFFEEREKDSIRRRGENISAWEVEGVLDLHPDVAESAVYGVASEEADEDVAAALVLRRADADIAAILRFAEERLPRFAVPALLRVVPDLPRTATEKVQKAELRRLKRADHLAADAIKTSSPTLCG